MLGPPEISPFVAQRMPRPSSGGTFARQPAMATEATDQLRQLEQDKAKYEAELEALTKAMPVEVACKE